MAYDISFDTEFHYKYFLHISDKVKNGTIDPLEAVYCIDKLYLQTEYNNLYKKFRYLADSIDTLQDGHGSLLSGMNEFNIVEYIINAFEIHRQVILLNLPENTFELYLCRNCQKFIQLENVFISNKLFRYMGCPICKTDKYETIMTNINLLRYLKEISPNNWFNLTSATPRKLTKCWMDAFGAKGKEKNEHN